MASTINGKYKSKVGRKEIQSELQLVLLYWQHVMDSNGDKKEAHLFVILYTFTYNV